MGLNAAQQAYLAQIESSNPTQDDDDLTDAQRKYLAQFGASTPEEEKIEEPGFLGDTKDIGVQVLSGIPKAVGAVTSLGSLVPGVHYVADPLSQGFRGLGEFIDDVGLSDYQKQQNEILSQRIQEAAATIPDMPEDASMSEKAGYVYDHMIAQGGEAAEYLKENPGQTLNLIAQTLPHIFAGGLIGKGLKGASAAAGMKPISSATAGAIGEGAVAAGDTVSNIVANDYEGVGTEYSADRLYGVPAGVATSLISKGGSKFNQFDVDTAVSGGAKDMLENATTGSILKSGGRGLLVEGGEEFLQSGQEQMFTNLGTDRPWYEDVGSSSVLGLATGMGLGGGLSAAAQFKANRNAAAVQEAEVEARAKEEAELQAQAEREAQEQGLREQAEREAKAKVRRDAAQTFTPRDEFVKAREAEDSAQLELDVRNPETEIGQAFEVQLNEQNIFDPKDVDKAAKTFIKSYQKENSKTDQYNQEYVEALDVHAEKVAAANAAVENNPELMEMDDDAFAEIAKTDPEVYGVINNRRQSAKAELDATTAETTTETVAETPVEKPKKTTKRETLTQKAVDLLGDNWEQDHAELSALMGDGKSIYSRGKGKKSRFETMLDKIVAEQAKTEVVDPAEPTQPQAMPETQVEETATQEIPEGIEARAVSYATEKLGDNWRENTQLVEKLKNKQYAGFQTTVDELYAQKPAPTETVVAEAPAAETTDVNVEPVAEPVAEPVTEQDTETSETTLTPAAEPNVVEIYSQPLPDTVKLSPNEQKVFDVLNEAFKNNEQDDVIQSNGSLNPTRIAERGGLKSRQAAQTAITRLRPKIAKAYGLDAKQIKQKLAETRKKNTEEFDQNAADAQLELQELGDGMGTIASANQGARDGMSQEDQTYLDEMEETPIRQQSREELDAVQAEIDADIRKDKAYNPAKDTWDNGFESDIENPADRISFEQLDAGSRFEWLHYFTEYNRGNLDLDGLSQEYDAIRNDYIQDNPNAQIEATDEVGQIESGRDTEATGQADREVREEGSPVVEEQEQESEQLTSSKEFEERSSKVKITTKKKRRVVKPPKNPEEAPAAKRQAEPDELNAVDAVAEKLGGEVVYQKGEVALVRGYSSVTGAPVYAAAKGSMFTNVDVESYTGDQFTEEQLADLIKAKQEAEAEAQSIHDSSPFATYEEGLAFSTSVTPELQGIIREWKSQLGLGVDVYVTTLEDAKNDKFDLTGPLRAVGSGTLDASERGSTRRLPDGSHYIIYDDQASKVATLETIAHEMGHVHQKEVFDNASPEMQKELIKEHGNWLRSQTTNSAKELVRSLRARKTGKTTDVPDIEFNQVAPYWKSFNEWYADQVSRWATTQDAPVSAVEKFFSKLGKAMKSFYEKLANKDYLPTDTFVEYLDKVKNANLRDPINDNTDYQSDTMAGSMEPNGQGQEQNSRRGEWVRKNMGPTSKQLLDDAATLARSGIDSLKFLHQFVREVKDRMPAAGRMYQAIKESDKTRQDIRRQVEAIAVRARELKPERLAAVNDFISKSTFFQKWGYDPQIDGKTVKVDPVMAAAFNRLSPKEQSLVRDVFQHGENMRKRKQEVAKILGVDKTFFSAAELDGPYAPLKRFGKYAGVLKSQELLDAEAADQEKSTKETRKKIEELKQSGNHYVVSFFDTMGAAKRFTDESRNTFPYAVPSQRTEDLNEGRMNNAEVFQKVLGALKAAENSAIDGASKKAFAEMIRDMYFDSLDERDARVSGAKRKNRAGYEPNMIRSFLSHARAEAAMIATMEHGAEINTALAEAGQQSDRDPEGLKPIYNMLVAHYKDTLVYQDTLFQRIQDRAAALNSVYMLTSSIGYHVTNATQPFMVTVPRLAGDFGDYIGAWNKLTQGYKVAIAAVRMTKNFETEINLDKVPPKYRALLEELQLRNLLDVGMEEDLSSFDRFNTGYEKLNVASDKLGMVTHKLYQAARLVEAYNRISSAVAAYDMSSAKREVARRQGMNPAEYAISVVEDTQGNFSRMDAPLVIKKLPKLTTQYRKYQLMMAWAYSNSFKQTFKGESKEMKATGRRVLTYMTAHAAIFAGVTGVPLVSTIAPYILAFTSGEDEPQDLDRWILENIPGTAGEVLSKGVFNFVGIDMSTKLSQGKIFDPFPYMEYDVSEDGIKDLVFNLAAGPSGTTMVNFTRSAEYFGQGDTLKGLEYMVPKGLRNAIESYRMATEGISFKNGDVVVDPREISVQSLLINALGLPASEINKVKWTRSQQYELTKYFSDESGRIRREYIDAKRAGSSKKQSELKQEWRDLQDAKDRVRPFFGSDRRALRRQPTVDLVRAAISQKKREKRAQRRFED